MGSKATKSFKAVIKSAIKSNHSSKHKPPKRTGIDTNEKPKKAAASSTTKTMGCAILDWLRSNHFSLTSKAFEQELSLPKDTDLKQMLGDATLTLDKSPLVNNAALSSINDSSSKAASRQ